MMIDNLTSDCDCALLRRLWALPSGSILVTSKDSHPALLTTLTVLLGKLSVLSATEIITSAQPNLLLSEQTRLDLYNFVDTQLNCIPLFCNLARALFSLRCRQSRSKSCDQLVSELISQFLKECFNEEVIRPGSRDYSHKRRLASMVDLLIRETLPTYCELYCSDAARLHTYIGDSDLLRSDALNLLLILCYLEYGRGISSDIFSADGASPRLFSHQARRLFEHREVLSAASEVLEQSGLISIKSEEIASRLQIHASVQIEALNIISNEPWAESARLALLAALSKSKSFYYDTSNLSLARFELLPLCTELHQRPMHPASFIKQEPSLDYLEIVGEFGLSLIDLETPMGVGSRLQIAQWLEPLLECLHRVNPAKRDYRQKVARFLYCKAAAVMDDPYSNASYKLLATIA